MEQLEFKYPYVLYLLIPYALMLGWYLYRRLFRASSAVAVSSEELYQVHESFRTRTYRLMPVLRFIAILCLIIALARPGKGIHYSSVKNLGIDIMVALDLSGSMDAEDFKPKNRLTVAKKVVEEFVKKRESDRIGLVVFASEAYLQCPLTVEHNMIVDIIDELELGSIDPRSTAIGDALALAASRMIDSKAKSTIILLITDGENNSGTIDPETAAETAKEMGVKIYSVGIGSEGYVTHASRGRNILGMKPQVLSRFDTTLIEKTSKITGGRFYRATSSGVLWEKIREIDLLEKTEIDVKIYHEFFDRFQVFLIIAMSAFFLEIILRSVYYRKIP